MKISVVIPAYNEEQLLSRCLQSLHEQSVTPHEVIVVDNNSTDETAHIASRFGAIVITEPAQGIWPAASAGYNTATGDIIARCDADSILPEDWIAKISDAFAGEALAVTGPGRFYDTNRLGATIADWLYMKAYFFLVGLALGQPPVFGSNFAMTKQAWMKVRSKAHIKRTDIHDDIDLSYHLISEGNIRYMPDLRVQISARPFTDPIGMLNRYIAGFRSIYIHLHSKAPWHIYKAKLRG